MRVASAPYGKGVRRALNLCEATGVGRLCLFHSGALNAASLTHRYAWTDLKPVDPAANGDLKSEAVGELHKPSDDRLKPPPTTDQYSAAVDTSRSTPARPYESPAELAERSVGRRTSRSRI